MRRSPLVVLAVSILLVGVSCGSSSPPDPAKDKATVTAADTTLADLPIGFTAQKEDNSGDDANDPTAACLSAATGVDAAAPDKDQTATVDRAFSKGTGSDEIDVDAEIDMERSKADVSSDLATMSKPGVTSCIKTAIQREVAAGGGGATVSDVSVVKAPLARVGDKGIEFFVTAKASSHGATFTVGLEVGLVAKGRAEVTFGDTSFGGVSQHLLVVQQLLLMVGRL